MAHPDLTSHHVNYLIWRYLQESGLGEAAVTLQRAWNHDPQTLPFAPYIRTHALVSLVQKGLQYHELERSLDKDGNQIPLSPSNYFFGPAETLKSPGGPVESHDEAAVPVQPSVEQPTTATASIAVTNGHLSVENPPQHLSAVVKKDRKSEFHDDGGAVEVVETTNGFVHEPPSPADVVDNDGDVEMAQNQEPAASPPVFTLTNGHSVGVQNSPVKAADLSPNAAILHVAGKGHVIGTMWRPRDPTVMVAAGDTFCNLLKLSSSSPPSSSSTLSAPVQEKLVEYGGDATDNACVSAVAWDPTGQKLAVATYSDMSGSITMYDVQGNAVDLLPEVPRMITGLHWAENSSHLVVVASDSRISELALWDDSIRPDEFPFPQVVENPIYDFAWLDSHQAYACGDGLVYQCDVNTRIHITKSFSSAGTDTAWTYIRCTYKNDLPVVISASTGTAKIWIPTHDMHLDDAHQGEITSLELRPEPFRSGMDQQHSPLILASSSTDDTVNIWHIDLESKRFNCVHRLFLGPSIPALTSSFSPDGYALAAASRDRFFIWNVERGGAAMATWTIPGEDAEEKETKKENGPDCVLNGQNGNADLLPVRSLSWDTNCKRLAFGFGNKMAIVNLQR